MDEKWGTRLFFRLVWLVVVVLVIAAAYKTFM